MIDKPSDKDVVKFDELLISTMHLQEALIELLIEKGVISREEVKAKTREKITEAKKKYRGN